MSLNASFTNTRSSLDRSFLSRSVTSNGGAAVRCKHCSKVVAVEGLDEHETFFCPLKPVRCQHIRANGEMCGFLCSGMDALRDHSSTCKDHPRKRRSVSMREGGGSSRSGTDRGLELCDDCQRTFPDRAGVTEHQQVCAMKSVPCPLQCGAWMPRGAVPEHILKTALTHTPLRRPSEADYGGDNIHMVVAVLMEALQSAAQAEPKGPINRDATGIVEPSRSPTRASPQRGSFASPEEGDEEEEKEGEEGTAAVAVELISPPSDFSMSLQAAGSLGSNGQPADNAVSPRVRDVGGESGADAVQPCASLHTEENDQDAAPLVNTVRPAKSTESPVTQSAAGRQRRRKAAPAAGKGCRSANVLPNATAAPAKAIFRASPSTVASPSSQVRYEDFVVRDAPHVLRVASPPRSVRSRPSCSRAAVSPRAETHISPRLEKSPSPAAMSPRVGAVNATW